MFVLPLRPRRRDHAFDARRALYGCDRQRLPRRRDPHLRACPQRACLHIAAAVRAVQRSLRPRRIHPRGDDLRIRGATVDAGIPPRGFPRGLRPAAPVDGAFAADAAQYLDDAESAVAAAGAREERQKRILSAGGAGAAGEADPRSAGIADAFSAVSLCGVRSLSFRGDAAVPGAGDG